MSSILNRSATKKFILAKFRSLRPGIVKWEVDSGTGTLG